MASKRDHNCGEGAQRQDATQSMEGMSPHARSPGLCLCSGADEDLAAAVGNQAPAAGGIVSVRATGGSSGGAAKAGEGGKKGVGMLYAKQDGSKKRGSGGLAGGGFKKGPKKQKK